MRWRVTTILTLLIVAATAVLPLVGCRCTPVPPSRARASCCRHDDAGSVGRPCCAPWRLERAAQAMASRAQTTHRPPAMMTLISPPLLAVEIAMDAISSAHARGQPPGAGWHQLSPILRV